MEYINTYNELKNIFTLDKEIIPIEGSKMSIRILKFTSNSSLILPPKGVDEDTEMQKSIAIADGSIPENNTFSYPVFVPDSATLHNNAIILLHGLNERSWLKYLPWAYRLASETNRPVILFPISFHMNRSPDIWANPREMMPLLSQRNKIEGLSMSTFANIALSQRLSDYPLRFFASGKQSADDITKLLTDIKQGNCPFLAPESRVDFFAYSIGAFLAQILFLANPAGLLTNSMLFLFCGGALFDEMRGTSRLIMDSDAYASLRRYYLKDFDKELKEKTPFSAYFMQTGMGNAFRAMLSYETNKKFREARFLELKDQIRIISLKNDKVIASNYIQSTFECIKSKMKGLVQELDFAFDYSHEIPFPVNNAKIFPTVNKAFDDIFTPAIAFLK